MEIYVLQYELRVVSFIYSSLRLFVSVSIQRGGTGGKGEKGERGEREEKEEKEKEEEKGRE